MTNQRGTEMRNANANNTSSNKYIVSYKWGNRVLTKTLELHEIEKQASRARRWAMAAEMCAETLDKRADSEGFIGVPVSLIEASGWYPVTVTRYPTTAKEMCSVINTSEGRELIINGILSGSLPDYSNIKSALTSYMHWHDLWPSQISKNAMFVVSAGGDTDDTRYVWAGGNAQGDFDESLMTMLKHYADSYELGEEAICEWCDDMYEYGATMND